MMRKLFIALSFGITQFSVAQTNPAITSWLLNTNNTKGSYYLTGNATPILTTINASCDYWIIKKKFSLKKFRVLKIFEKFKVTYFEMPICWPLLGISSPWSNVSELFSRFENIIQSKDLDNLTLKSLNLFFIQNYLKGWIIHSETFNYSLILERLKIQERDKHRIWNKTKSIKKVVLTQVY